ncbi:MAG TPA: L-rhamnose mutarotase [Vicinamibacterales bacterium]|jgi:L-rhamnose mutarotase|nr:L-rhamnose mutarotase [Vicinamibacterales bacterium]
MTRHVLAVDLKDDPAVVEAYKAHHRRVWPEVLHSLRRVGIADMQIYLLGRRLVMVVDMAPGRDFTRAFAQHVASDPRVGEWEALMKSMQQPAPGSAAGDWWAVMQPVFDLNFDIYGDADSDAAQPRPGSARRA